MPKIKFSDWDELLVRSQKAESQFNVNSIGNTKRGIFDLEEATRRFNDRDKQSKVDESAMRLLARNNFDAEALRRDIQSVQFSGDVDANQRLRDTDIDSFLTHHHDTIILSTINESRKSADIAFRSIQGRWAADEWSKSKSKFMDALGHKPSSWNSLAPADERSLVKAKDVMKASSRSNLDLLPSFLRGHIDIFRKLSAQSSLPPAEYSKLKGYIIRPAVDAVNLLKTEEMNPSSSSESNRSDMLSYKTLLEILAALAHEDTSTPRPGGYFSPLCFDHTTSSSLTSASSKLRVQMLYSTRHYFEKQILQIWTHRLLDSGSMLESTIMGEGYNNAQIIRSFIAYLHRSKLIPNQSTTSLSYASATAIGNNLVSVWVYVYHSLRAGDFICAIQELERVNIGGNHDVIISALRGYHTIQKHVQGITSSHDMNTADITTIITKCRFLYHQEMVAENKDHYKELVLNLLSLSDQDALTDAEAIINLEDFLWANLWFEYYALTQPGGMMSHSSSLYDRIIAVGGSSYYDEDGTTPFVYATVLFACERYGDAINYLWKASKSLHTVHLMLICLHYGLILPHTPLLCNPRRTVNVDASSAVITAQEQQDMNITPLSILSTYTDLNFNDILPDVSIDYLSFLHTHWHVHAAHASIDAELLAAQEFKSMMVEFEGYKQLFLSLNQSQLATAIGLEDKKSGLYRYMDVYRVKRLLGEAAREKLHHQPADAISMLEHADMFPEALAEICNQLVMTLSSSDVDTWRSIAIRFHDKYVKPISAAASSTSSMKAKESSSSSKAAALQKMLTDAGKSYLVDLLEILLQLSLYFIYAQERRWEDALSILDDIKLLPANEEEAMACMTKYQAYDQSLLRLIDDIIQVATECLLMQYDTLRSSRNVTSFEFQGVLTSLDMKLKLIRNQTKSLSLLCERLSEHFHRKDTVAKMKRLAVNIA